MVKKIQFLLLAIAVTICGTAMAQKKAETINGLAKVKNGRTKTVKPAQKKSLFTKATTLFSEDFSTGLPATWTIFDADGDGFNWDYDSIYEAMVSYSFDTASRNALNPNNFLITPTINIPNTGAMLSFSVFSLDDFYSEEHYSVRISISGSADVDSFYVNLLTDTLGSDIPTTKKVSLMQFAGQTVRLAFVHHDSVNLWAMAVDDVEIIVPDSVDVAVSETDILNYMSADTNLIINATIDNLGFTAINNLNVYCDVDGSVTSTTIASLPMFQSDVVSFSGLNFSTLGSHNVKIYVSVPDDSDTANDTISEVITVLPDASLAWDFEGSTQMPAGFATAAYDGATAYSDDIFPNNEPWVVSDISNQINYGELPMGLDGGANVAVAQSWFDENDSWYKSNYPANRWMVTPKIILTSGNFLMWDAISWENEFPEDYRIRVSTTNTDTALFATVFTQIAENGNKWQRRAVDLSAYAGQSIYIAFQLISDDQNMLVIDNIKIMGNATVSTEGIHSVQNGEISVYPNPTTGKIAIGTDGVVNSVEIFDVTGRVVLSQNGNVKTLNISSLADGVYTMRVVSDNGVALKRVIKK